jgi:hypothetical protein
MDSPRSHTFVPCGHLCVCATCSDAVMAGAKECPICRVPAQMAMRIHAA